MARGRGYGGRGSGFRGSSRGGSSWGSGGNRYGSPRGGRFSSPFSSTPYDRKYSSSDRYPPRSSDDYRRSYRQDSYSGRDSARSPDRKRARAEASSSRHDSYGGYGSSRYESSYSDRRSFSDDRHPSTFSRRSEFRRPSGPPLSSRGGYRGRISSRGARGMKFRDRPVGRRLLESSYSIRRRIASSSDYNRRLRLKKMLSVMAGKRRKQRARAAADEMAEDESQSDEKEESENEKEKSPEKTEEKAEEDGVKKEKDEGSVKEGKSEGEEKPKKSVFIKLVCPHCITKAPTFYKYERHLSGLTHRIAMRKLSIKQKSILQQMRIAQRKAQNELEKSSDDLTNRTSFCPICKLNYKQKKAVHQATESHKNMKKFLFPYCKVCNITFKTPMQFESHCCSIEHLKRKQRVENGDVDSTEEDNLENFTTIDSVGDNDDGEEEEGKDDSKVNVGIELVRKVEAHYCDLCKMYLPRGDEVEMPKIVVKHCKNKVHLQRYIRKKELQDIEKRAEKLQRKEIAEKEEKDKVKEDKDDTADNGEGKENKDDSKANDDEEARDDKLWADVDKDIGDILAEAESGNKSSDEDEEDSHANAERYDRFKYSEKNGDEKLKKAVDGVVENGEPKAEEVKEAK